MIQFIFVWVFARLPHCSEPIRNDTREVLWTGITIFLWLLTGSANNLLWHYNLIANPDVEIRDETQVYTMRVREVTDSTEGKWLWAIAVEAFPRYQLYLENAEQAGRTIPVSIAEPIE